MYVYKVKNGKMRELTRTNFETDTKKDAPYYTDDEKVQYAICPCCDNPIQIRGLYKRLANTDRPYAKHYDKSIVGLADCDFEDMRNCVYLGIHKNAAKIKRSANSKIPRQILNSIKKEFHAIVSYIQYISDVNISKNLAEVILKAYIEQEAYLYPATTLVNYPIMVAYFGNAKSLYRQFIKRGSELEKALKDKSHATEFFLDDNNQIQGRGRSYLRMSFIEHGIDVNSGEESMKQLVFYVSNDCKTEDVFERKIIFDYDKYQTLLNKPLSDRDKELLNMAEKYVKI